MPNFNPFIVGAVLPAAVSLAILLAGWAARALFQRRFPGTSELWGERQILPALAIAAGYAAGQIYLTGQPGKPVEPLQWLPYIVLGALALSAIDVVGRVPSWLTWIVEGIFCCGCLVLLLRPSPLTSWTPAQSACWLAGLWSTTMFFRVSMDTLARRVRGSTMALLMVLAGTAASALLVCSANITLGQLGGALTSAVGPILMVGAVRADVSLAGGGMRVIAILFCGLLVLGYFNDYSELPWYCFPLVTLAPLCAWCADVRPINLLKRWQLLLLRIMAVLIPAAVGVFLASRVYLAMAY